MSDPGSSVLGSNAPSSSGFYPQGIPDADRRRLSRTGPRLDQSISSDGARRTPHTEDQISAVSKLYLHSLGAPRNAVFTRIAHAFRRRKDRKGHRRRARLCRDPGATGHGPHSRGRVLASVTSQFQTGIVEASIVSAHRIHHDNHGRRNRYWGSPAPPPRYVQRWMFRRVENKGTGCSSRGWSTGCTPRSPT